MGDTLSPLYAALLAPVDRARALGANAGRVLTVMDDNRLLREENDKLRKWQTIALALDAENAALRAQLRFMPDAAPSFVTARVVADTSGLYARSVLVAIGPNRFVRRGQIVLDASGLVGRGDGTGQSQRAGAADYRPEQPGPGDAGDEPCARDHGR